MLVIRLQRTGRENLPSYRLVVAEKARPVKGKTLEILGHYLPARDTPVLEKKDDRIKHWVSKGAIPSDTVARILKRSGLDGMDKFIQPYVKRKSKKEVAAALAAPPVEAPKAESTAQKSGETTNIAVPENAVQENKKSEETKEA